MRIDLLTLFPEFCEAYAGLSILGRAQAAGKILIRCHNIRDYTQNRQKQVDDAPYGGRQGMVMSAQPVYDCFAAVAEEAGTRPYLIYMSPQGRVLTQQKVKELAARPNIAILAGHYEGVDQRVIDAVVDEEISVGDYVVTGGELPALLLADAVARLQDGVLSEKAGYIEESHYNGLLEHPQYTRPEIWMNRRVPEVLLSGHHAHIEGWKEAESLRRTMERRPDLYKIYLENARSRPRGLDAGEYPRDSRVFLSREGTACFPGGEKDQNEKP